MALTIKASEQSFIRWRLHSWSKRVFYIPAFVRGHSSIQPKRRTIQMEKHFTRAVAGTYPGTDHASFRLRRPAAGCALPDETIRFEDGPLWAVEQNLTSECGGHHPAPVGRRLCLSVGCRRRRHCNGCDPGCARPRPSFSQRRARCIFIGFLAPSRLNTSMYPFLAQDGRRLSQNGSAIWTLAHCVPMDLRQQEIVGRIAYLAGLLPLILFPYAQRSYFRCFPGKKVPKKDLMLPEDLFS